MGPGGPFWPREDRNAPNGHGVRHYPDFVREDAAAREDTSIEQIDSAANTSDIFTKSLGAVKHHVHCTGLGIRPRAPL